MNWNDALTLSRENTALKAAIGQVGSPGKVIHVSIGEYKGYPTISFDGVGRPFSLGLKKAAVVLQCEELIRDFVATNRALLEGYTVMRHVGGGSAIEPKVRATAPPS